LVAVASTVVCAAAASVAVALVTADTRAGGTARLGPATQPSGSVSAPAQLDPPLTPQDSAAIASGAVTFGPPPSNFVVYHAPDDVGAPSDGLLHVQLPHPAPGFPVRLQRDRVDDATTLLSEQARIPRSAWVATFSLGTAPERRTTDASGATIVSPNGPTAQVSVIDAAVTIRPDAGNTILGDPVIATTDIDGHRALVTRGAGGRDGLHVGAVGLYFTTSRFTVMVVCNSTTKDVALARALIGI